MKKCVVSLLLFVAIAATSLVHAQLTLIHSEDFETSPPSWTTLASPGCSSYPWKIVSGKSSSGEKSAIYESYYAYSGCYADIISPTITVNNPGADDSVYMYIDVFRDNFSSSYNDKMEFTVLDGSNNIVLGPVTIYRYYQKPPASPAYGWIPYVLNCKLSLAGTGNNVSLRFNVRAVSDLGENMFIDNVRVYHSKKTPAATLQLTNPNGGDNLFAGKPYNITWASSNVDKVNIDFTIDGGLNWVNIASNVLASTYSYSWIVPSTSSATCKVRVSNADKPAEKDESDAYFTISGKSGMADELSSTGFQLYPNPSTGRFSIQHLNAISGEATVVLYNLQGGVVFSGNVAIHNGQAEITLPTALSNGSYMVEINDDTNRARQKLQLLK